MSSKKTTFTLNAELKTELLSFLKKYGLNVSALIRQLILDESSIIYRDYSKFKQAKDLLSTINSDLNQYQHFAKKLNDNNKNKQPVLNLLNKVRIDKASYGEKVDKTIRYSASEADEIYRDFSKLKLYSFEAERDRKAKNQYQYFLQPLLPEEAIYKLKELATIHYPLSGNKIVFDRLFNAKIYVEKSAINDTDLSQLKKLFDEFNSAIKTLHEKNKTQVPITENEIILIAKNHLKPISDFFTDKGEKLTNKTTE